MSDGWEALKAVVPSAPDWRIDWQAVERSPLGVWIEPLAGTIQDAQWHGEGNVWNHTKLVCECLVNIREFRRLDRAMQETLFLAALLHDIGKIRTTKLEDGRIRTPRHGEVGSRMARVFLWTQCGLCGMKEKQIARETICRIVRYHMAPPHMLHGDTYRQRVLRIAAEGELLPEFTIERLAILSQADNRGRICDDLDEQLELIELSCEYAKEQGCFAGPAMFAGKHVQRAYFAGRDIQPDQPLYDDTWGEVILMCGLPGTGKDTWIAQNCADLPVVSLDDIRDQMGVKPTDNQGAVVQAGKESARKLLRAHQPFVMNATHLTPISREPLIRLFEQYGARVRIVYLETEWDEQVRRNGQREKQVPLGVIADMLERLCVPERHEAAMVEWICV